jgi:hypothetical protein
LAKKVAAKNYCKNVPIAKRKVSQKIFFTATQVSFFFETGYESLHATTVSGDFLRLALITEGKEKKL